MSQRNERKKSRKAKKGAVSVDPKLVVDMDSWLRYYAKANCVFHDGAFLVLDPAIMATSMENAIAAPVKTILPPKGYDFITLLRNPATGEQLRVAAEEKRDAVRAERNEHIKVLQAEFIEAERQMLEAVDAREALELPAERVAATLAIGNLMKTLAEADSILQTTVYPKTYAIQSRVESKMLFPDTRDPRIAKLMGIKVETTLPQERLVPLV